MNNIKNNLNYILNGLFKLFLMWAVLLGGTVILASIAHVMGVVIVFTPVYSLVTLWIAIAIVSWVIDGRVMNWILKK